MEEKLIEIITSENVIISKMLGEKNELTLVVYHFGDVLTLYPDGKIKFDNSIQTFTTVKPFNVAMEIYSTKPVEYWNDKIFDIYF